MDLLFNCIVILVSVFVDSSHALNCYQCTGLILGGAPQGPVGCFDPFSETEVVQCNGECFANSTSSGEVYQEVNRGCMSDPEDCSPTYCQDVAGPEGSSGRLCNYCCQDEMCNSMSLEEAAASAGTINCWNCQVNFTDSVSDTSCASDDFNGEGAFPIPCDGKCVVGRIPANADRGTPEQFTRTCDNFNMCEEGDTMLPSEVTDPSMNFEFECCEGNLCNVMNIGKAGVNETATKATDTATTPSGCSIISIHSFSVLSSLIFSVFVGYYFV